MHSKLNFWSPINIIIDELKLDFWSSINIIIDEQKPNFILMISCSSNVPFISLAKSLFAI